MSKVLAVVAAPALAFIIVGAFCLIYDFFAWLGVLPPV